MLDYAAPTLRGRGYAPYYLYRQKYMSGSFENIGWSHPGAQCLYNIEIMSELCSILSFGAGGSTQDGGARAPTASSGPSTPSIPRSILSVRKSVLPTRRNLPPSMRHCSFERSHCHALFPLAASMQPSAVIPRPLPPSVTPPSPGRSSVLPRRSRATGTNPGSSCSPVPPAPARPPRR